MMQRILMAALFAVFATSCGGQPGAAEREAPRDPAGRLEAILATPITPEQDSAFVAFTEQQRESDVRRMLRALAVDSSAPALARANAVLRMGQRLMLDFDVYSRTIMDPDPRVRGATLGTVGPLASRSPPDALPIISRGLVDSEIGIQAKALQELRDRDLDLLRFYLRSNPPADLREIALQSLRVAESRGAPLTPDARGVLRRTAPTGVELVFSPDTTWPQWDAAMGHLGATPVGGTSRVLADSVEAVAGVIPAAVDPNGRYVALEAARRIEVHDLETGAVRVVGPGTAPRPMPLSPDFMYFREYGRTLQPDGSTTLRYEAMQAPFAGGAPMVFDTVRVNAMYTLRGQLSPLRWVRILDRGTAFVLDTDGLRNHVLPLRLGDVVPDLEAVGEAGDGS